MGSLLPELLKLARETWYSRRGLALSLILVVVTSLLLFGQVDFAGVSLGQWLVIFAVASAVVVTWFVSNKPPKRLKDKIGVALGIAAEDDAAAIKLANDLYAEVVRQLSAHAADAAFQVLVIPNHMATQIRTEADALNLAERIDSHVLIWGDARLRQSGGKKVHSLRFHGMTVRHAPIPEATSHELSQEMSCVFPVATQFPEEIELEGFVATAATMSAVVSYVLGVTAFAVRQLDLAEALLTPLKTKLELPTRERVLIEPIRRRLPRILEGVYRIKIARLDELFRDTGEKGHLIEVERLLPRLREVAIDRYPADVAEAICAFVLREDTAAARTALGRCKRSPDSTWKLNLAFVLAFEGRLAAAEKLYRQALASGPAGNVLAQCEIFLDNVLRAHPEKAHLHYCLGLINHYGKCDYALACEEMQIFLRDSAGDLFEEQRVAAEQILREIAVQEEKGSQESEESSR